MMMKAMPMMMVLLNPMGLPTKPVTMGSLKYKKTREPQPTQLPIMQWPMILLRPALATMKALLPKTMPSPMTQFLVSQKMRETHLLRLTPLCEKSRYLAVLRFDLQVCRSDPALLSKPHLLQRVSLHFIKLTLHLHLSALLAPLAPSNQIKSNQISKITLF
jgi:hypothetical protein